nr:recombinase family protein [Thiohalocapsa marina]
MPTAVATCKHCCNDDYFRSENRSTTDPTGRMFLGILITFAQYEREVIAERIRDKVAAAKRRGKYCGGVPILGYDVDRENKKLLVNPDEARTVQYIFRRFIQIGSAKKLGQELNEQGYRTKAWTTKKGRVREGSEWNTAHIYRLLNNRIYIGEIAHKDRSYPGEHEGIIDRATWDKVQAILEDNKPVKISMARTKMVSSAETRHPLRPLRLLDGTDLRSQERTPLHLLHLPERQQADREPVPAQTDSRRGHRAGGNRAVERGVPHTDAGGQDLLRGPGHRAGGAGGVVQAESPTRDGAVAGAGAGT